MGAMEGSAIGFLIKALVYQCESEYRLLLVSLALPILLAFTRVESLMATSMVWLAPTREFLDRPALAFLILNCVIATLIARSKLGVHKQESKRDTMRQNNGERDEKGGFDAETATEEKCHYLDTQIQSVYGQYPWGQHPQRKNWSAHACNHEHILAMHEQANLKKVIEKKPASNVARNIAVSAEPPAAEAATTAHPSMDEVWAAIMASKKTCLRMACKPEAKLMHSSEAESAKYFNQPQLNAAVCKGAPAIPPAILALDPSTHLPLFSSPLHSAQAACTAGHPQRAANAGPKMHPGVPSKPRISGAADGINHIQKTDRELEELNHRAEELIASFHRKMRLQREQSLERQKRGAGLCNHEVQYPEHPFITLRASLRGVLVG